MYPEIFKHTSAMQCQLALFPRFFNCSTPFQHLLLIPKFLKTVFVLQYIWMLLLLCFSLPVPLTSLFCADLVFIPFSPPSFAYFWYFFPQSLFTLCLSYPLSSPLFPPSTAYSPPPHPSYILTKMPSQIEDGDVPESKGNTLPKSQKSRRVSYCTGTLPR